MRIGGERPSYDLVPIPPDAGESSLPARAEGRGSATFARALRGLATAVDRGEALMASAAHGNIGGLDSAQLIALQAGIYRYSEAVDLVAKLVDRASNAVRTVISPH
jgi:hypothetical protein